MNYYRREGISQSFLKKWALSPAHAQVSFKSEAMDLGSLVHALLLEPAELDNYVVEPAELMENCSTRAVKGYKTWAGQQTKEIIKISDWQACEIIQKNFNWFLDTMKIDNIPLRLMFDHGEREVELSCNYKNEKLKGKADWIYEDAFCDTVYIFDLKTTSNIHNWSWEIEKFKYHWQLPYYAYLLQESKYKEKEFKMFFVFLETSTPYFLRLVELSDLKAFAGEKAIFETLEDYIARKDEPILPFDCEVKII